MYFLSYHIIGGILCLTGAQAALGSELGGGSTSFAVGYGMSKAATHQLAKSMADEGQLPENSKVITILPATIDTKANRESMPDMVRQKKKKKKKHQSFVYL